MPQADHVGAMVDDDKPRPAHAFRPWLPVAMRSQGSGEPGLPYPLGLSVSGAERVAVPFDDHGVAPTHDLPRGVVVVLPVGLVI